MVRNSNLSTVTVVYSEKAWMPNEQRYHINIIFPRIVSTLQCIPPLDSFRSLVRKVFKFSLHKGKIIVKTIWFFLYFKDSRKNSFCGKYSWKYSIHFCTVFIMGLFTFIKGIWIITTFQQFYIFFWLSCTIQ